MARNGSGTYNLPQSAFVYDTVIDETKVNSNFSDIADALTASISKDGQTTPTANLPMGGFKLTGLSDGSAKTDSAALGQVQGGAGIWCGTAGGTANAITLTPSPAITAYAAGQRFEFKAGASASTGAITFAISGLSAIAGQVNGATCTGGEVSANQWYRITITDASTAQIERVGKDTSSAVGDMIGANNLAVGAGGVANAATAWANLGGGTAGKLAADTDPALTANSDSNVATQKAVKAYVASQIPAASPALKNLLTGGSALTNPWQRGTSIAVSPSASSNLVPTMTSNTAPSGTASASAEGLGGAWQAFDASPTTYWGNTSGTATLAYQFTSSQTITQYSITCANLTAQAPATWTFEGWTGSAWVVLDTRTSISWSSVGQVQTFSCSNSTAYIKYQINMTATGGNASYVIGAFYMYGVIPAAAYTADGWKAWGSGNSSSLTVSQQASGVTASPYCFRLQRTASNADTGILGMAQVTETINVKSLQGKTITLSFQARSGANYSAASSYLVSTISTGTGSDQGSASLIAGTWTGQVNTTQNNALSTSFQTFTQSITVPSTATELAVRFSFTPVGTAGASDYFELLDVQDEVGSSASTFEALPRDVVKQRCAWTYRVYATSQNASDLAYQMRATPTAAGSGPYAYSAEL